MRLFVVCCCLLFVVVPVGDVVLRRSIVGVAAVTVYRSCAVFCDSACRISRTRCCSSSCCNTLAVIAFSLSLSLMLEALTKPQSCPGLGSNVVG